MEKDDQKSIDSNITSLKLVEKNLGNNKIQELREREREREREKETEF